MTSLLISGGTGTFGYGFTRHALDHQLFDRICLFSRNEHAQATMRQKFADDQRLRWFIGDVRDLTRLRRAMSGVDIVIHAAALKRIEVGYTNPTEMVLTNINGAINVVEAARLAKVKKVIMLSTDKAFQPVSPYGYSKAMAEWIMLSANDGHGPRFTVCRYGNIAGSSGSVIPIWRKQIAAKEALTITNPECTRFFMTINQAVEMVAGAIETMKGGEIVTPELPAYCLADLATAIYAPGQFNGFKIVGLSPGEKLAESMDDTKCSKDARRMSVEELGEALKFV